MKLRTRLTLAATLLLTAAPTLAAAQNVDWNSALVQSALGKNGITNVDAAGWPADKMLERLIESEAYVQSERLSRGDIKIFKKNKKVAGLPNFDEASEYFSVIEVQNPDGKTVRLLRMMPPEEVQSLKYEAAGTSTDEVAAQMTGMSDGLVMLGAALRGGIGDSNFKDILGDEDTVSAMIIDGEGQDACGAYFATMDVTDDTRKEMMITSGLGVDGKFYPITYMMGPACMLAVSAQQLEDLEKPPTPEFYAKVQEDIRKAAAKYAKVVGDETVDGHTTKHIEINGVKMTQKMDDGSTVTVNNMHFWLDPEYFVRRKFRMEGTINRGKKSEPFFMERENQDYRRVGTSYLYEPYMEVMRVGGMISDKDRQELARAQKEMDKAKAQLAQLPPAQRAMVENMMAEQMAQLDSLANTGAAEIKVATTDIELNPDFASGYTITTFTGSGAATLVRSIQTNLATLGFNPGPATGQVNAATKAAISAYQSSRGISVDGEATPALARKLQDEVDAL
ncbi:MAG: peptidoglycan-binding domain-containing protein [Parvularculaceae bacterium]